MVVIQLEAGCRAEHITTMRLCDIDTRERDVWLWTPYKDKTGNRQPYTLGLTAINTITQASRRPDGKLATPEEFLFRPLDSRFVWHKMLRERYDTGSYRQAIRRGCDKAGVDKWTPHQLRKLRGQEIGNQYGVDGVRAKLCHTTTQMADHYSRDRRDKAVEMTRHENNKVNCG